MIGSFVKTASNAATNYSYNSYIGKVRRNLQHYGSFGFLASSWWI
jgi:hypothetical protein